MLRVYFMTLTLTQELNTAGLVCNGTRYDHYTTQNNVSRLFLGFACCIQANPKNSLDTLFCAINTDNICSLYQLTKY